MKNLRLLSFVASIVLFSNCDSDHRDDVAKQPNNPLPEVTEPQGPNAEVPPSGTNIPTVPDPVEPPAVEPKKENIPEQLSADAFSQKLQGAWTAPCASEAGNLSSQISITINQATVEFTLTSHSDPSCTNPSRILIIPSTFKLSTASKIADTDVFPIDYTTGKASLKFIKTQSRINRTCNTGLQWIADQSQDVTGRVCSGVRLPNEGQLAFDIVALNDNKLLFGWALKTAPENAGEIIDAISNNTPELRPKLLAETIFERK